MGVRKCDIIFFFFFFFFFWGGGGGSKCVTECDRGYWGPINALKKFDIIYEQPLISRPANSIVMANANN